MSETTNNTGRFKRGATGAHIAGSAVRGNTGSTVIIKPAQGATGRLTGRFTGTYRTAPVTGKHEAARATYVGAAYKQDTKRKKTLPVKLAACAAVVLVCFGVFGGSSGDKRLYSSCLAAAEQSYMAGDYDSAISNARRASGFMESDEVRLIMADSYTAQGKFEKALEILRGMDLNDELIAERIDSNEQLRREALSRSRCIVGGSEYPLNAVAVSLGGRELGNGVIDELGPMYGLVDVDLSGNGITDISGLSRLGGITTLRVSGNAISDISPIERLTSLRVLYLDNNPISSLECLKSMQSLRMLSVSGCDVSENELSSLSMSLPGCTIIGGSAEERVIALGGIVFEESVKELNLSGAGLIDISGLSFCRGLEKLDISGNSIDDISPLTDLNNLTQLDISNNGIADIRPLMTLEGLSEVDASDNYISSTVALGYLGRLEKLDLSNNPISDFSGLRKLDALKSLKLDGTGLCSGEYLTGLTGLSVLSVCDNPEFSGESYDSLAAALPGCSIEHSGLLYSYPFCGAEYKENTTRLLAANMGISDISEITRFCELDYIDLSGNNISDVNAFASLRSRPTTIDLSGNMISDPAAVTCLRDVRYLNLANNSIRSATLFKSMYWLEVLDLNGNDIPELQIKDLRAALPNVEIRWGDR